MPQLVLFNRKWSIGSDDFVFAGIVDAVIRSIWFVVVLSMYCSYQDEVGKECPNSIYLHVYFIGLLTFLVITALLAAIIGMLSNKGTIAESGPRKHLTKVLYARIIIAVPEVTWNALGTFWTFRSCKDCHKNIVNLAKGTVIAGWVVFLIAVITFILVFNLYNSKKTRPPARMRSFKRGSKRPFSQEKAWEKRCKCMFMCANNDNRNTSVFKTLAELSADYFKGVDLVPTDVVAGLILLSRKQERKRQQLTLAMPDDPRGQRYSRIQATDVVDSSIQPRDDLPAPKEWMTLDLMSNYLKFALGSYGWPFYVTLTNPVFGLCTLCTECRCFSCGDYADNIYMDNCCLCNAAAFKKTTGVQHEDIIYASFKNDIYEIPFYVVIDRHTNSVVIAIRGTLSLQDVLTDLVIERGDLNYSDIPKGCAHKGILHSAYFIKETLEEHKILETAFSKAEGADLVITGHSLGAGAAAMVAILLKPTYPKLRCFAFSPPGELVAPCIGEYAQDVVCSVVLGDDIITRQGMLMMDDLKIQILQAIHQTRLPKYKILAGGCWRMCSGRAGTLDEDVEFHNVERDTKNKQDLDHRSSLEISLTECTKHSEHIKNTYQTLQLPGQILHIEESTFSGDEEYIASWKGPENFTEIIVSPNMLSHHFPDALLDAIDDLRSKDFEILVEKKPPKKVRQTMETIMESENYMNETDDKISLGDIVTHKEVSPGFVEEKDSMPFVDGVIENDPQLKDPV